MTTSIRLGCRCGRLHLAVDRDPIIAAECHCDSCRAAAARLAALPGGVTVLEDNGGTRFVVYRKDRVHLSGDGNGLREFRLTPEAGTRRVVAACCNTPLFLEFKGGHWLSLYAGLWPAGTAPRPEIRTMTGDRTGMPALDATLPSGAWPTARFYARLLGAWIAMGFRVPDSVVTGGTIDA